jgi:iron uptake system component EfeO
MCVALALGAVLVGVGCSKDDGRAAGETSPGSLGGTTDNALVDQAVAAYKAAYASSREGWERIEPIAGLVADIDARVDSRADDFSSVDDPEFTGWHRSEYLLWERSDTASAVAFARQLERDLAGLATEMEGLEIPPAVVAVGASELIDELSQGKITGEEDRYSRTDMWDMATNVEGSQKAIELLTPALQEADPALLQRINTGFDKVNAVIAVYRTGDGYQLFTAVTAADLDKLKTTTAQLSELLSQVAGALGLVG